MDLCGIALDALDVGVALVAPETGEILLANTVARRYLRTFEAEETDPTHLPLPLRLTHGDPQAPNVMIDHDDNYLVVDWEFAAIGDPREDLGWYNIYSTAAGPNLYEADPEAFLAAYREVTGFGEAEVNQLTVGYFTVLSSIKILGTISTQLDKFALGENSGAMTALQVGSISFGHDNFINAIADMQAAFDAMAAAAEGASS